MSILIILAGMIFTGCPEALGLVDSLQDEPVTISEITVTTPEVGAAPAARVAETDEFTGTVTWEPAHDTFAHGHNYIAEISLVPKDGFTLSGVPANFFTVAGADTTHAANPVIITAIFPEIESPADDPPADDPPANDQPTDNQSADDPPAVVVEWEAISGMSPADGVSVANTRPEFSWNTVDGAVSYEVQIADSPNGLTEDETVTIDTESYRPDEALTNNRAYYWKVRAVDGDGQKGQWSSIKSFVVEWGEISWMSPKDGFLTLDSRPTVSWTAVNEAVEYELQFADNPAGFENASTLTRETTLWDQGRTAFDYEFPEDLQEGETGYWRVRAKDEFAVYGAWSDVSSVQRRVVYNLREKGPAGGLIFYINPNFETDGWKYLEAWTSDESGRYQWNWRSTSTSGTSAAIGKGYENTYKAMAGTDYDAAEVARNASHGGFDDWFLPSLSELHQMFANLYLEGVGGFADDYYWSSSENGSDLASSRDFGYGLRNFYLAKDFALRVRVIRAF